MFIFYQPWMCALKLLNETNHLIIGIIFQLWYSGEHDFVQGESLSQHVASLTAFSIMFGELEHFLIA